MKKGRRKPKSGMFKKISSWPICKTFRKQEWARWLVSSTIGIFGLTFLWVELSAVERQLVAMETQNDHLEKQRSREDLVHALNVLYNQKDAPTTRNACTIEEGLKAIQHSYQESRYPAPIRQHYFNSYFYNPDVIETSNDENWSNAYISPNDIDILGVSVRGYSKLPMDGLAFSYFNFPFYGVQNLDYEGANFVGAEFQGKTQVSNLSLENTDFSFAKFKTPEGFRLSGAKLDRAKFIGTDGESVQFFVSSANEIDMRCANFFESGFAGGRNKSEMNNANFLGARFQLVSFTNLVLKGAVFSETKLVQSSFSNIEFDQNSEFSNAEFVEVTFNDVSGYTCNQLAKASLRDITFNGSSEVCTW